MGREPSQQTVVFHEDQRPTQAIVVVPVLTCMLSAMWLLSMVLWGEPHPEQGPGRYWLTLIVAPLVGFGLPVFWYMNHLIIQVRGDGIYYRYAPYHRAWRRVGFEELAGCDYVVYRPIRDYGGWGIRWGRQGVRACNVKGNQGVMLRLTDGRSLLLGSQRAAQLADSIRHACGHGQGGPA